jgi:hypothetical protein
VYYRMADARTYELCDLVCGQIAQRLVAQVQGLGGLAAWPPAKSAPKPPRKAARSS